MQKPRHTYCKCIVAEAISFLLWSHVSFSLSAQVLVLWARKNKTEKRKKHLWEGRKHIKWESSRLGENGESREVGAEEGWTVQKEGADTRSLRLVIEMSPTSSSCELNYNSSSSWPRLTSWHLSGQSVYFSLSLLSFNVTAGELKKPESAWIIPWGAVGANVQCNTSSSACCSDLFLRLDSCSLRCWTDKTPVSFSVLFSSVFYTKRFFEEGKLS